VVSSPLSLLDCSRSLNTTLATHMFLLLEVHSDELKLTIIIFILLKSALLPCGLKRHIGCICGDKLHVASEGRALTIHTITYFWAWLGISMG